MIAVDGGIRGVELSQKARRTRANDTPFRHGGVNRAGHKIDAGQQAQRSVSDIFVIARQAGHGAKGLAGKSGAVVPIAVDAGLFVVGDDRKRRGFLARCADGGLLEHLDFAIDAQDLGHLLVEQGIAAFQIVAHLVRLDLICGENFAQRALSKIGETFVSHRRTMFANVPR